MMCGKKEPNQESDDEEFDGKSDLIRLVGLPKMQEMFPPEEWVKKYSAFTVSLNNLNTSVVTVLQVPLPEF